MSYTDKLMSLVEGGSGGHETYGEPVNVTYGKDRSYYLEKEWPHKWMVCWMRYPGETDLASGGKVKGGGGLTRTKAERMLLKLGTRKMPKGIKVKK